MDFLIWIVILFIINGIAGGKKKPRQTNGQSSPPERRPAAGGTQRWLREFVQDVQTVWGGEENSQPRPQTTRPTHQRPGRQRQQELTPIERECDYCVGTNPLPEPLSQASAAAPAVALPIVPLEAGGACSVDMGALRERLELSDAQSAILWQEILDKPLALRHRR